MKYLRGVIRFFYGLILFGLCWLIPTQGYVQVFGVNDGALLISVAGFMIGIVLCLRTWFNFWD